MIKCILRLLTFKSTSSSLRHDMNSCILLDDTIMLFHSVTEEDVVRRNFLAKSCPYCVRNSLLEDQNHSIGYNYGVNLKGYCQVT